MSRNRIGLIIVALVLVGFSGLYGYTYMQVDGASNGVLDSAELVDFQLVNLTLVPPSADLLLSYSVRNPSGLKLILSLDTDIYYGDAFVTNLEADGQVIEPNGRSTIDVTAHLEGSIIDVLRNAGGGAGWTNTGRMTFTHMMLGFVPVTVVRTGNFTR